VRRALSGLALVGALAAGCASVRPESGGRGPPPSPGSEVAPSDPADRAAAYAAPGPFEVDTIDLELDDPPRTRTIPVRLRVPRPCDASVRRPLVLFSHGLGGSRSGGAAWGAHWAGHGFAVAHLQHPGSDESLWRGRAFALETLRAGLTAAQYVARIDDVRVAAERLGALAATRSGLACVDVTRIGMAGHSFGAATTLAIAGQWLPASEGRGPGPWAREPRVAAALALSPSVRDEARRTLAGVGVPVLVATGSLDDDVVGNGATPETRRAVYEALPPQRRALLWLDGADHFAFSGGESVPGRASVRRSDAEVHRVVRAVGVAFWRATLQDDAPARAWLDGDGPRALLGPADAWRPR
jgi:predicted dienelactone hydrolase